MSANVINQETSVPALNDQPSSDKANGTVRRRFLGFAWVGALAVLAAEGGPGQSIAGEIPYASDSLLPLSLRAENGNPFRHRHEFGLHAEICLAQCGGRSALGVGLRLGRLPVRTGPGSHHEKRAAL